MTELSRRPTIAISGTHGLIGSALAVQLAGRGYRVRRLVRTGSASGDDISWNPARHELNAEQLAGSEAVVHLGGESIARRWTRARRARMRASRIESTRLLGNAITSMSRPPRVFLCASAVGFYGSRGDELLDETSSGGSGFLAELVKDWEEAAMLPARCGVRVVHLRFGVVLSRKGGALPRLLLPFRLGLGGPIGSGRQWMSWIALPDCIGAIEHAMITDRVTGAVNVVSPAPVTNGEFTRTLARILRRPAIVPVPSLALRVAYGQMAEESILASQRVQPGVLTATSFRWRFPALEQALRDQPGG